jgi:hypothetical protein
VRERGASDEGGQSSVTQSVCAKRAVAVIGFSGGARKCHDKKLPPICREDFRTKEIETARKRGYATRD